jgi:hypothetical protein
MYVGFKSIAPEMDIGFDLSKEYAAARALHEAASLIERSWSISGGG